MPYIYVHCAGMASLSKYIYNRIIKYQSPTRKHVNTFLQETDYLSQYILLYNSVRV